MVVEPNPCTYGAGAEDAQVELVEAIETVTPLGPIGMRLGGDVDVLAKQTCNFGSVRKVSLRMLRISSCQAVGA